MACERCCLKYEKPVSQLYTPAPPKHTHRLLAFPPTIMVSISPLLVPPLLPFQKAELFPTCELQLHFPGQSSGGNVAPAGAAASPLPSASALGSAGPGEGPGAAVGGFDPHLLEAGAGRRRREGWSARRSLALGVLTVPELKLSAAASAGKLRGARGPRTKLEKSKQAAAAGKTPSFPLPVFLLPALALLLPSSSSGGERVRSLARRLLTFASPLFCLSLPVCFPPSADHGESGQQLPAAPSDGRLPLLEALRRLRGQDCGPLSAVCHGQLLA